LGRSPVCADRASACCCCLALVQSSVVSFNCATSFSSPRHSSAPLAFDTAGSQDLSQGMDEQMYHVLRAGTQMEHRKNLHEGVDGQPEHMCGTAHQAAQFVQLEVRELQGV